MDQAVHADQADVLARTLWGEARGEGMDGMAAVANVVCNRARIGGWWGGTVKDVCLKRAQFSCWNEADPNRDKMLALTPADPQFADALVLAHAACAGLLRDRTGGATHYYVEHPNGAGGATYDTRPGWAARATVTARLGRHVFVKDV